MKYLILLLLLSSCSGFTPSKGRCHYKVGLEKVRCIAAYDNFLRSLDYREFRGRRMRNF